jgi:hypothetical protein
MTAPNVRVGIGGAARAVSATDLALRRAQQNDEHAHQAADNSAAKQKRGRNA